MNKEERLRGRKLIEQLFQGGQSRSMTAFPIRMVYMKTPRQEGEPGARIMVIVGKRHFKRAVKRNRAKRQMREAYRNNKHLILAHIPEGTCYNMALIWQSDEPMESRDVEESMVRLLRRLDDRIVRDGNKGKQ